MTWIVLRSNLKREVGTLEEKEWKWSEKKKIERVYVPRNRAFNCSFNKSRRATAAGLSTWTRRTRPRRSPRRTFPEHRTGTRSACGPSLPRRERPSSWSSRTWACLAQAAVHSLYTYRVGDKGTADYGYESKTSVHCLALRAPTLDSWLEIAKSRKFVFQGWTWIIKF